MHRRYSVLTGTLIAAVGLFALATAAFGRRPVAPNPGSLAVTADTPNAPSHCTARVVPGPFGITIARVTWKDNSDNEDGFIIEWWSSTLPNRWELRGTSTVPANSTSGLAGVSDGGLDRYRVKAFNAFGDSGWSNYANLH